MSDLNQITLVVQPPSGPERDRYFYRYDHFADQLRPHTSATISVIEDEFSTAPTGGLILLDRHGAVAARAGSDNLDDQIEVLSRLWDATLRRRLFCLDIPTRGNAALTVMERLELAGAIDQIDYQVSVRELGLGTSYGDSGLYGVRRVAERLGCTIDYGTERYCKTVVPPFKSLGELLARYLEAYWVDVIDRDGSGGCR